MPSEQKDSVVLSSQLLLNVAEELKMPFLQISRKAEIGQLNSEINLNFIQTAAQNALNLLDNYTLGVRMSIDDYEAEIEPVSVSSVLYDASVELDSLARAYGVDLGLSIAGRYGPVMANRRALQAALVSLGAALIQSLPARQTGIQLHLQLATHRSPSGIVAGLYSNERQFSKDVLKKGRELSRKSRQPLINVTHTSGAGIFVADALLNAMDLHLHSSKHRGLYGLGVVLKPTHQVELF